MAEIAAHLPIETEHLILRPFTEDELPALAALHADPNLMRWIPRGSISVVERLPVLREQLAERELGYACVLKATGEIVGEFTLRPDGLYTPLTAELGALLAADMQGRGYAAEAATAMIERAFRLGFDRVVARTDPRNARSVAAAERLGMQRVGESDGEVVYAVEASG